MKRCLIAVFVALSLFSSSFAMTVGEMMTLYFDELLPQEQFVYRGVDVQYTDVKDNSKLQKALKKAIYHSMFPNASVNLQPDRTATVKDLTTLLLFHFGFQASGDERELTQQAYDLIMGTIRGSYSYTLIQSQNALAGEFSQPEDDYEITKASNFTLLNEVYTQLKEGHYDTDSVSDEELIYGAARGIAEVYGDPYTTFLDPVDVTTLTNELTGDYAGIGAYVDTDSSGYVIITGTLPDSPAREAGLQAGDRIVSVDSIDVPANSNLAEVVSRIIGPEGTQVDVVVQRGGKTHQYILERQLLHLPFVQDIKLQTGEYYIALYSVGSHADDEFIGALKRFRDSGAKHLIIDLRDNPGGTLGETRVILDAMIPKNRRAITIKTTEETYYMYSYDDPVVDLGNYEVAILINGGTASAAEIIAGTVEDYFPDEVRLVGEQTYGKGSVQQVLEFYDGSGLKFTTAKWFTGKSRRSIDKVGITPEYAIEFRDDLWKKGIDFQLESAKEILNRY